MIHTTLRRIANKISAVKIEDLPSNAFSGYYIGDTNEDSIFIDSPIHVGLGHPAFGGMHEETWTVSEELEEVDADTTKLNSIWEKHLNQIDKLAVERDKYTIYPSYNVSGFDYWASSTGDGYFTFHTTINVKVDELTEEDLRNIESDLDDYISDLSAEARALSYDLNNEFKRLGVEFLSETGS